MKTNIIKVENPHIGLYYEGDKPYMSLKIDCHLIDGSVEMLNVPRIDLSSLRIRQVRLDGGLNCSSTELFRPTTICNLILSVKSTPKGAYFTTQDITPRRMVPLKEMTIEEIEKELGHKIKITAGGENK